MIDFQNNAKANARSKCFDKFLKWYRDTAVIVLSTLILLISFVLLSYTFYVIRGSKGPPVYSRYLRPQAMHRMNTDQAVRFFKEFDRLGENETFIYQPWVGFSERVFHSTHLNVDDAIPLPTRRTIQNGAVRGGRPLTIWTFGGSTMFGWGVPDEETIASHLSAILSRNLSGRPVRVINHGHCYFFSSQELALFQVLLRRGGRCDVAIFLDGLNDSDPASFQDAPAFTDRMMTAMAREQGRNPTGQKYLWVSPYFPPARLLRGIGQRLSRQPVSRPAEFSTSDLVNKYQFNVRTETALGSLQGIKTLFFWQPVSAPYAKARELARQVRQTVKYSDFHFIADIFEDMDPRDIYVDYEHYGDLASARIAEDIALEVLSAIH